jgi:hypothetical protein
MLPVLSCIIHNALCTAACHLLHLCTAAHADYAPFDVDVTTEDPGEAALRGDGIRVVIGGSSADWYGDAAGGVAWVGSFGSEQPAFVWPALLGPFKVKYVADAAAHEAGHTLGLLHDGNSKTAYYAGHGNWAPIMVGDG